MSYKYAVFLHTGYCGMEAVEFIEFDKKPSQQELDMLVDVMALQNAESYGIYRYPESDSDSFEEEGDCYSDNIDGYAEEYDPEKHDMYSFDGVPQFTKY